MKKQHIIVLLVLLVVVFVVVYASTNDKTADQIQTPDTVSPDTNTPVETGDREVQGSVIIVNTAQVAVDGPALINLKLADGSTAVIAVPSMGLNFCTAKASLADVYKLKTGDKVEVRGTIGEEGRIIPCESASHYLRVVTQ